MRTIVPVALWICGLSLTATAQDRKRLPDVSTTIKGDLALPIPLNNPLFSSITETVGMLGATIQFPIYKGLGAGVGANMSWFAIEERALAPVITSGEIRRAHYFGKVQYERYTGERTFYELHGRLGVASYVYECATCPDEAPASVFHWGAGVGYYLHATDNLAFGLTMTYEMDNTRFSASDLGLESFPGRREVAEDANYQSLIFGMTFSTRLRRSPDNDMGW